MHTTSDLESGYKLAERSTHDIEHTFKFSDITYTVGNDKRILHGVSGAMSSGQFVALMGSSGMYHLCHKRQYALIDRH